MSKVFVNIALSLDGYMAPDGMTLEHWDTPQYRNWGAKWGALMAWLINQRYFRENLKFGPGGETGPTGVQMQSEWTLEDDALEYVQLDSTGVELRISATVTIDEPELVAAGICPDMSEYVIPYTATETTYTRQP